MKKTTIICVMALLCLNLSTINQSKSQENTLGHGSQPVIPFKQGEKLPDSFWEQQHLVYSKGKVIKQNLSAYRDKILILDYWATWCGSCIRHMGEAGSLQQEYGGLVAMVLVNCANTRDTPEKIDVLMKQSATGLSTIILDTLLTKQFPHRLVPHYVWIVNNAFTAATGSEFVNRNNIEVILDGQQKIKEAHNRRKSSITNKP